MSWAPIVIVCAEAASTAATDFQYSANYLYMWSASRMQYTVVTLEIYIHCPDALINDCCDYGRCVHGLQEARDTKS